MKIENGERVTIPDVWGQSVIPTLYICLSFFCKESNYINPLSSSSLYEILRACPASKITSLKGRDNIATDGASAFDTLNQVIQKLQSYVTKYFYLYQQLNYIYGTNFLLSCSTQIGKTYFTKELLQNADKMFSTPVDQIIYAYS